MGTTANQQIECSRTPILSSRNQGWENILVEQFQHPAGEGKTYYSDEHSICLSLSPRPVHLLQTQGDKTRTGPYMKGDFCITPAKMPFFARWDSDDRFLQIRVTSRFIQSVAGETLHKNSDQLELRPKFRVRDPQIEAIAKLLQSELKQENWGERLYVDSLTNLLAVHLLRQYAAATPVPIYEGGLPERQLMQVVDYIYEHLDQEIRLADLAALLDMSQFHFSHLFKQAIGTAPYQYLLQQRIERAKQLLKQSDPCGNGKAARSITDIAFMCGFNSHSHLSKQFRQLTGMTPTAYRAN